MDKQRRGEDAADRAPKERAAQEATPAKGTPAKEDPAKPKQSRERQDGPNYDETTDGGRAIPSGDLSSANDE